MAVKREDVKAIVTAIGGYFYTNITCDCDSWFVNGDQ